MLWGCWLLFDGKNCYVYGVMKIEKNEKNHLKSVNKKKNLEEKNGWKKKEEKEKKYLWVTFFFCCIGMVDMWGFCIYVEWWMQEYLIGWLYNDLSCLGLEGFKYWVPMSSLCYSFVFIFFIP